MFTWLISTEVLEITFDKEHYLQGILQDIAPILSFSEKIFPLYNQNQSSDQQFIKVIYRECIQ